MSSRASIITTACCCFVTVACDRLPGKPPIRAAAAAVDTPEGFATYYALSCAGCHGADGTKGPARPMRDAAYLAAVPEDSLIAIVRDGVQGTRMPGFSSDTDEATLARFVQTMRVQWGGDGTSPSGAAAVLAIDPANGIAWQHVAGSGDARRGAELFETRCVGCHPRATTIDDRSTAGSVTDRFYLKLVSDQHLRTSILFGRSDLSASTAAMPGARGPFRGADGRSDASALSAADVDDLVAYLSSLRGEWPPSSETKDGAR